MWRAAGVDGCHVRGVDAVQLAQVEPGAAALREHGHLRGTLTLPSGQRVVCGALSTHYDGVDEVELYLPLGALVRTDPRIGGYPFGEWGGVESLTWRALLDRWLADVATTVFATVPFSHALIGFETDTDVDMTAGRRHFASLLPGREGLEYLPATA